VVHRHPTGHGLLRAHVHQRAKRSPLRVRLSCPSIRARPKSRMRRWPSGPGSGSRASRPGGRCPWSARGGGPSRPRRRPRGVEAVLEVNVLDIGRGRRRLIQDGRSDFAGSGDRCAIHIGRGLPASGGGSGTRSSSAREVRDPASRFPRTLSALDSNRWAIPKMSLRRPGIPGTFSAARRPLEDRREGLAVDELHGKVGGVAVDSHPVHPDDAGWWSRPAARASRWNRARSSDRSGALREDLEGHAAVHGLLPGLVHDPHAPWPTFRRSW